MKLRTRLGGAVALVALAFAVVVVAGSPGALATQGSPITAGQGNSETAVTRLYNTTAGFQGCDAVTPNPSTSGLFVCGSHGLMGAGTAAGLFGITEDSSTGYGVEGKTVKGTGVYGDATVNGAGVFGDSPAGTGVQARSTTGTALNVLGKAKFSRSGLAFLPSGSNHVTVNMSGATTGSMILATVQQKGPFFVKNVVPATGSFTIYLNKAPAYPNTVIVAYFVLN